MPAGTRSGQSEHMRMLTVRAAAPADASAVVALWRVAGAEPTHTDDAASLCRLLEHDPLELIVAEADGNLMGSVIAAWDGQRGAIYRLVVVPSERRHGLGRRLLRAAERRLANAGASRLQSIVVETDVQAAGFWRASGWEEQVERLRFVMG